MDVAPSLPVRYSPEQRDAICYSLGMMLVHDGSLDEGPSASARWPCQTVADAAHQPSVSWLDAIRDGWRVIQFPDLVLLMDMSHPRGLGCEFLLEK